MPGTPTPVFSIPTLDGDDLVSDGPLDINDALTAIDSALDMTTLLTSGSAPSTEPRTAHGNFWAPSAGGLLWNRGTAGAPDWAPILRANGGMQTDLTAVAVTSGPYNASDGELVLGGWPLSAVTLPEITGPNMKVGVCYSSYPGGSASITITATGDDLLRGVGFSGVASIELGAFESFVIFQSDPTSSFWQCVGGGQDTGWRDMTPVAPVVLHTGAGKGAQSRWRGDTIYFRGGLTNAGSAVAADTVIATFTGPQSLATAALRTLPVAAFNPLMLATALAGVYDTADAPTLQLYQSLAGAQIVWLDGMSISVAP